ncbi:MAG: DNA repair exonuclease [candidate division FCPU426 bacterium]
MKPPLKFIHTADLHLGAKFVQLGEKGRAQRERLRATLAEIAELAVRHQVRLVLLAGDLFDSAAPSPESLAALRQAMSRLSAAGIRVLMIAGTHDAWDRGTALNRLASEYPGQLIVFTPQTAEWNDPELQVTIQGISLRQADEPKRPVALLRRTEAEGWHLGLAHAALELGSNPLREAVFTPAEVEATQLDYLALGHWHRQRDCSAGATTAWYSGSPETIALDEAEPGSVLLVTLEEGKKTSVEPLPVGKRRILRLAAEGLDQAAILKLAGAQRDPEAILDLTLTGLIAPTSAPDLDALRKALEPDFFFVRLHNAMHAEFTPEAMAVYPESTVIGRFIRLAQERKASANPEKAEEVEAALQLGLSWLLGRETAPWS